MGAFVMAVDIGQAKLDAATNSGADIIVDPTHMDFAEAARAWTNGEGVEAVLELVGPATMPSSLKALGKGGRMVIVGSHTGTEMLISPQAMIANEWEILGSRNVTKRELAEVVALVAAGRVQPIVSEIHPLEEAETLHARLRKQAIVGRAVLEP
jgi:D-arabinose 1-dehydrogenase-like Zn-dependent alcohol dehydrogenase